MITGHVMSVETRNLGEPLTVAANIGDTVLNVADASTFDEAGGLITIQGVPLAYTSIDTDNDTITLDIALTVAVAEQDPIEMWPAIPIKTALVAVDGIGDAITATVPHTLLDKFPDGVRDDDNAESVTLIQRGAYEFVLSDAIAQPLVQASLDYSEAESGIGLTDTVAQLQDVNVLNQLGAATIAADTITLGGTDLAATLDAIPDAARYALKGASGNINAGLITNTELRMFTYNAGPVLAGHVYDVGIRALGQTTVAGDTFWVYLRYTIDGSEPTTASPRMDGGQIPTPPAPASNFILVNASTFFAPATDGNLRISVSAIRLGGTGSLTIRTNAPEAAFQIWCQDRGIDLDSSSALQQTLKTDGSGSDNPPVTTKTYSFLSLHHEDFYGQTGSSGSASFSDQGYAEIGWNGNFWGSPQSGDRPAFTILHFNYADIVSKLASATSIESVQLKFRVRTRETGAGLDMSVFAHKYTSFPWTMAQDMSGEITAGRIVLNQGSRNDCAPNIDYTINLSTAVGTNLKSGLYKGIGLTTPVYTAAGMGTIYAPFSGARPVLIIKIKAPA